MMADSIRLRDSALRDDATRASLAWKGLLDVWHEGEYAYIRPVISIIRGKNSNGGSHLRPGIRNDCIYLTANPVSAR